MASWATGQPHVPISLGEDPTLMPFGDVIIDPTPHSCLAMQAVSGLLQRHAIRWQDIHPSQIPYRQL